MSYTNIDILPNLINKKVLFFDLETSGKPKNENKKLPPESAYPSYKSNEDYDSSRIVQIGFIKFDDFDYDYEVTEENITSIIVRPDGFVIPDDIIKIHGITNEQANEEGIEIKKAMKKMKKVIEDVDYIIGYNVYFDVNILMNELYRSGHKSTVNKINNLRENKNILCVGELSRQYKNYKIGTMPKQVSIYKELFNEELINAHNAINDILATIKIFYWFHDNINNFKSTIANFDKNYGTPWTDEEYNKLIYNLLVEKSLDNICKEMGRNEGGIRGAIKRLIIKGKIKEQNNVYSLVDNVSDDKTEKKIIVENEVTNGKNLNNTIISTLSNHGKKWESKEILNLVNEINKLIDIKDIINNHKRTKYGVLYMIKKLVNENDYRLKNLKKINNFYDLDRQKLKTNILKNISDYNNLDEICEKEDCSINFLIDFLKDVKEITSNNFLVEQINLLLEKGTDKLIKKVKLSKDKIKKITNIENKIWKLTNEIKLLTNEIENIKNA